MLFGQHLSIVNFITLMAINKQSRLTTTSMLYKLYNLIL